MRIEHILEIAVELIPYLKILPYLIAEETAIFPLECQYKAYIN
jgi:hypothetical protein